MQEIFQLAQQMGVGDWLVVAFLLGWALKQLGILDKIYQAAPWVGRLLEKRGEHSRDVSRAITEAEIIDRSTERAQMSVFTEELGRLLEKQIDYLQQDHKFMRKLLADILKEKAKSDAKKQPG